MVSDVPPPSAIPAALWREMTSGIWIAAVRSSLTHYLTGLAVGAGLGILLGVWAGMSRAFESATAWIVRLIRPIPGLAWVPFAIIWFGVEPSAAVFIIAIGVFWIVFFATQVAVRGVDRDVDDRQRGVVLGRQDQPQRPDHLAVDQGGAVGPVPRAAR